MAMMYALIVDGRLERVVDSPTDLDRMPFANVKRMCQQLQVPARGVDLKPVLVVPIRPDDVVRWDLK
jgi:hypothetical protein